jgi:hypothetical protein
LREEKGEVPKIDFFLMQFRKANGFIVSIKHKLVLYELELRAYGFGLELKAYIQIGHKVAITLFQCECYAELYRFGKGFIHFQYLFERLKFFLNNLQNY